MAPSVMKMAALVAALLLLASTQARGSATEEATSTAAAVDMVPVSPPESVMAAMPGGGGGVGTMAAAPVCLQCRCCSRSNPAQCQITGCCSTFNCNPAGRCTLVQQKCGCGGCGGAN